MKRLLLILVIMAPQTVMAASYYADTRLMMQTRENALSERETPFSVYLDTGLNGLPKDGTFDVSLRNNKTFSDYADEFDLYQAVFRMKKLGDTVDVSAGRQFINPGFHAYLMDGLSTTIGKDDWPILITLLGGVPRYIESGEFKGEAGLIAGTTLELNGVRGLNARLSAVYDSLDANKSRWKEINTVLTGLAVSYYFDSRLEPNIYGDFEYDTAGKVVETGIMGFKMRPTDRLFLSVEGGEYNTNRRWRRTTIFGLYGDGPFYQGRAGVSVRAIEAAGPVEDLLLTGGYSFQRYKIQSPLTKNANLADGGLSFEIAPVRLQTTAAYRFFDSPGGRAHDVYVELHSEPADILAIDLGWNYTKYSKITNEKSYALGTFLMTDFTIVKNLVLSAGGEYLRNATFANEWRATAKLSYRLEGKI